VAPGTILEVFQPGYVIEDRVLRPAMVVVAKGGQKGPKPAGPDAAAERENGAGEPADPSTHGDDNTA
jgi:molecular chaperone GrpE